MATERLSMTKTREILRQKWKLELSYREIGLSVGSAVGAVWLAMKRATDAGLDWAAVEALDEVALGVQVCCHVQWYLAETAKNLIHGDTDELAHHYDGRAGVEPLIGDLKGA
jgi:hypothetical protein